MLLTLILYQREWRFPPGVRRGARECLRANRRPLATAAPVIVETCFLLDATLVWLANHTGSRDILTVDASDFSVYRLKSGKRFALLKWFT